jgi:HAMP domain-containing protein
VINHIQAVLKALGNDERRKARNLLLSPTLQLKLPLYILLLSCTFLLFALLLGYTYFDQLYIMMVENTEQGQYLQNAIGQQTGNFIEVSITLLLMYIILMVAITVLYTHRIIGPTIPLARHIRALKEGLYSHRVNLRKQDELKELAVELNELAEILEQRNTS